MRFESSGVISIFIPWTPDRFPLPTTTNVAEQRGQGERQQAQVTAEEQSGDAATEDKKVEHAEGDKAGKNVATTTTDAAKAKAVQSDRTSGAYRLL